jgi:hypothetical protein
MLDNVHDHGLTVMEMAFLAGSLFAAGSDTVRCLSFSSRRYVITSGCQTTAAICTVLMAAACFPEEQAKVQAELDAVIGKQRGSLLHSTALSGFKGCLY